ncbi:conserved hypothetical protein, partial [Arthrobacter sp. Hiyo6]
FGSTPRARWCGCAVPSPEAGRSVPGSATELPGHPIRGEEAFEVRIDAEGEVTLAITAFGVPSNWFYALGGAVTRRAQRFITSRYIESAHELAAGEN